MYSGNWAYTQKKRLHLLQPLLLCVVTISGYLFWRRHRNRPVYWSDGFIGAADKRGEDSIERICVPGDFLATIYHHLGIDSRNTFIKDFNGRSTPIVDHGSPIPELIG